MVWPTLGSRTAKEQNRTEQNLVIDNPIAPWLCSYINACSICSIHTHTHTRLTALFPGLPGWAGTRKVKPILILVKQETVSGSGISWATCKSASRSRQITMPVPHHSSFYRPDALPAAQPTASKHCIYIYVYVLYFIINGLFRCRVATYARSDCSFNIYLTTNLPRIF